ncbi:MAG: HAD family hydrolase [Spirochaetales bacterium]|nr:HAD family hydrolase [Spirochaetales bacterium]
MKYDILILDHDDTCVASTEAIHYPCHLEVMKNIRPDVSPVDLNGWFSKNFHPGIMSFLVDELKFSQEEVEYEKKIWREFTDSRTPEFFPGIVELLRDFKTAGGRITVVSHSEVHTIKNLYEEKAPDIIPDLIFGWDDDPAKRKPNPWPAREILKKLESPPEKALMVDDLKPGIEMAAALNIPAVGAGWGHAIPEIMDYMENNTESFLNSVDEFRRFIGLS